MSQNRMKQRGPIPNATTLANTLAERLVQLRELRNMTVRDLARSTKFGIRRIEDIQAGLETWLSAADRQVLAKALSVEPYLIEEVETRFVHQLSADAQSQTIPKADRIALGNAVLAGKRELKCPVCNNLLRCSVQKGFDIDENPTELAKAYCTKCPFIL